MMMKRLTALSAPVVLLMVAGMLACASAQDQSKVPAWVSQVSDDATNRNFVGIASNARSLEEARSNAVGDALNKLVAEVYGGKVTTDVRSFRSDVNGKISDDFSQKSTFQAKSEKITDLNVARWEWTENKGAGTYNAFVIVAYPLAKIKEIRETEVAKQTEAEAGYEMEFEEAKTALSEGRVREALRSCVESYSYGKGRVPKESLDKVVKYANDIAKLLTVTSPADGKYSVTYDGKVVPKAQMVAVAGSKTQQLRADESGVATLTNKQGVREVGLDVEWFLPTTTGGEDAAFERVSKTLEAAKFKQKVQLTGARVLVMVDETMDEDLADRSIIESIVGKKLLEAGFKYITETNIGKVNFEKIDDLLDRGQPVAIKQYVKDKAEVVIHGTVKAEFSSEVQGIKSYTVEGTVTATRIADGVTVATDSEERVKGFGSSDKAAAKDALKKFAEKIAEVIISQLQTNE